MPLSEVSAIWNIVIQILCLFSLFWMASLWNWWEILQKLEKYVLESISDSGLSECPILTFSVKEKISAYWYMHMYSTTCSYKNLYQINSILTHRCLEMIRVEDFRWSALNAKGGIKVKKCQNFGNLHGMETQALPSCNLTHPRSMASLVKEILVLPIIDRQMWDLIPDELDTTGTCNRGTHDQAGYREESCAHV